MQQQAVEKTFLALPQDSEVVVVTSGLPRALLRYMIKAHWRQNGN